MAKGTDFEATLRLNIQDGDNLKAEVKKILDQVADENQLDLDVEAENLPELRKKIRQLQKEMMDADMPVVDADKSVKELDKIIRKTKQYEQISEQASQSAQQAHVKTTLASQNVLRIVQDLPYGMMGIANNVEQLGESTGRLAKQTGSLGAALKNTFMPLVTGPMALAALVTVSVALVRSWDDIASAVENLRMKLKGLTEAQIEYNNTIEELRDGKWEEIFGDMSLAQLDEVRNRLERTKGTLESTVNTLKGKRAGPDGLTLFEENKLRNANARIVEIDERLAAISKHRAELQSDEEISNLKQQFREEEHLLEIAENRLRIRRAEAEQIKDKERREALLKEIEQEEKILDLRKERKEIQDDIDNLRTGFENTPKADRDRKSFLSRLFKLQQQEKAVVEEMKAVRASAGRSEGDEADPFLLQELAVEAMRDGLQKQLAQIELNGQRRRAKIREEFKHDAEARKEAIEFANQIEMNERQQAFDDRASAIIDRTEKWLKEYNQKQAQLARRQEQRARFRARTTRIQQENQGMVGIAPDNRFARQIAAQEQRKNQQLARIAEQRQQIEHKMQDASLKERQMYNARLEALANREEIIRQESADRIAQIEKAKRDMILSTHQQILRSGGQIFSDLASMQDDASKKGFEQKKKYLKSQAAMDAISAGVGIYRSYANSPIPAPLNMILAGVQSAAVVSQLTARVRDIENMEPGNTGVPSGSYTSLNSAVTGDRMINYERQRQNKNTRGRQNAQKSRERLSEEIVKLRQEVGDMAVTIDDPTSAEVVRRGAKRVKKLEGIDV